MNILVVGGAGYIGSHMVKYLLDNNDEVIVLDNLSTGYRDAVIGGTFIQGDMSDTKLLATILAKDKIDAVMHFASFIEVGESVANPAKYYANNVVATLALLDTLVRSDVQNFIFSSTAAIFGTPERIPIDEGHPKAPINPYGWSKLMVEQLLKDYDDAYGLKSVCLRYFNAAGADPSGSLGERHQPESHLIPLVLKVATGERAAIKIFGTDYDTKDGTCVRDYIHVMDLCQAHILALNKLMAEKTSLAYNLGNGHGYSVREVIDKSREITGRDIPAIEIDRRPGDPASLVADSKLAISELEWQPQYSDLATIIEHAWQWENRKRY